MGRANAALVLCAIGVLREARCAFPRLRVRFRLDEDAGTEGRRFGFYDEGEGVVGLAPRLAHEPAHRQKGILRHEMGHAIAAQYGRERLRGVLGEIPPGDENLADFLAGFVWGEPILYDSQHVQSTTVGSKGRPGFLPR